MAAIVLSFLANLNENIRGGGDCRSDSIEIFPPIPLSPKETNR